MAVGRVIGTAGHVDHGKTALCLALTGIDTDRLPEEKARGITIELGFAHLTLPSGESVGVVDVPGHERLVRTMIAGAIGFDLVLLVIAADEGMMPQTREHLDICALLGIERAVVALTKCDAVDGELRELAMAEVAEGLRGSFAASAPIVACSAKSGEGIDALKQAIAHELASVRGRDPDGVLRLPLDRVFTLHGFGTVVTGTLASGTISLGDEVVALPSANPLSAKVRGLHMHGAAVEVCRAGQRTAVNLSLPKETLARGQTLTRPNALIPSRIVDVRVRYLPSSRGPLKRRTRLLFLAGCAQTEATLSLLDAASVPPGGEALAQLHLDHPQLLLPNDRFILRGFAVQQNHGATLGGGRVLRVLSARSRHGTPSLVATLCQVEAGDLSTRVRLEVERAGTRGLVRHALGQRLSEPARSIDAAIQQLLSERTLIRFDKSERDGLIATNALAELVEKGAAALAAFHAAHPLLPAMPREQLREKVTEDSRLYQAVLERLAKDNRALVEREAVRLSGHDVSTAAATVVPLAERVAVEYRRAALAPPRPAECAQLLSAPLASVVTALDLLVRGGRLVRIQEHLFDADAVAELRVKLTAFLSEHGQIDAQGWKELTGQSRKFTIPLAEHFDAAKVTLRIGDVRKLRR